MMNCFRNPLVLAGVTLALAVGGADVFGQGARPPAARAAPAPPRVGPAQAFADLEKLFQEQKWAEALAAAQAYQRSYPISALLAGAMYFEGWSAANLKQHEVAKAAFEKLLRTYPESQLAPEALLKLAESLRELKDYDKAIETYQSFFARYPRSREFQPQAMLGIAVAHLQKEDLENAKAALGRYRDAFRDEWENNFDGWFLLAQILVEEKKLAEAQEVYEQIASRSHNPRAQEGLYLAAQTMLDEKRYAEAITFFKRVQPQAALLAEINRQLGILQANRPTIVAQAGASRYEARVEALQKLEAQVKSRPDLRVSALFRMAECYVQLDRPQEAAIVYRYLLEKYPDHKGGEHAHFMLIRSLTDSKRLAEASAESEKFKAKYPDSILLQNAALIKAEALFAASDFAKALPLYQEALAQNEDAKLGESLQYRIAACHFGLQQWPEAHVAYDQFIEKYPTSKGVPDALFRGGMAHFEIANGTKDPEVGKTNLRAAIEKFEKLRKEHPLPEIMPDVLFRLGYLYNYLAAHDPLQYEQALKVFEEFRKSWPGHRYEAEVIFQIGKIHGVRRQFDAAVAAYRDLLQAYDDHALAPFAAYEIGATYKSAGRREEMIEALEAFATKFPANSRVGDALYTLAEELENQARDRLAVADKAGAAAKLDDAIKVYRRVVELGIAAAAGDGGDGFRNAAIGSQLKIVGILEQREQYAAAIAECEKFIEQFDDQPAAVRRMMEALGRIYRAKPLVGQGYAKLDELRAKYAANTPARIAALTATIELAIAERNDVRANQAAALLLADPASDSLPALTYVAIGNSFLQTGQFDRAFEAYTKMGAAFPDDTRLALQATLGIGKALLGKKQYAEATAKFKEAAAAPNELGAFADAQLGLAKIAEAQGRLTEAVDGYNEVLRVSRGEPSLEASFRLGNIFFAMNGDAKKVRENKKAALAYYGRLVLSTGPMAEEALFRMAECHEALASHEAALRTYRLYLNRYPDGRFAEKARDRVKVLSTPAK